MTKNLGWEIENNGVIRIGSGKNTLLELNKNRLWTIDQKIPSLLLARKSKLIDAFVDLKNIETFISFLKKNYSKISLNHVGFCYQVESKDKERKRLQELAKEKGLNFYDFPSNDSALWLFIGGKEKNKDPIIEFLPVENVSDYYSDYWLPHIQIDLDSMLPVDKIKYATHDIFNGNRTANPTVAIDGIIYGMRVWLGVVSGVNISLDMGTEKRGSIQKHRRYLFEK